MEYAKEEEIRHYVKSLINLHTPLLDEWFDRICTVVPEIVQDKQTESNFPLTIPGITDIISITEKEALLLIQEVVNEQLFNVLYYQLEHFQHCPHGCSVSSFVGCNP